MRRCSARHICHSRMNRRLSPSVQYRFLFDMDIVRIFLEIHFLRAECEFVHPLTEPPKMEFTTVRYFGSASPSLGSLIPRLSICPPSVRECCGSCRWDVPCLRVQSRSSGVCVGVVIPLIHSVLFRPFTAITQVFVTFGLW